jgi:hypothetical protein
LTKTKHIALQQMDREGSEKCRDIDLQGYFKCYYGILEQHVDYKCKFPMITGRAEIIGPLNNCSIYGEIQDYLS